MQPFDARLPPNITFGEGTIGSVANFVGPADRALIVTNRHLDIDATIVGDAVDAAATIVWSGEPTVDGIQEMAARQRAFAPTVVVGVGGGSVLDAAKALAAAIPNHDHDLVDYLEVVGQGHPLGHDPLRVIAAPATAGTGSEMTKNAVLDVPAHNRKVSLRDIRLIPDAVIIDPDLAADLPSSVASACALDAAVQLVESYATPLANPFSDTWAFGGARHGLAAAEATVHGRSNTQTRAAMAYAASCSGVALAHSKLGTVHGFAGVVGGVTGMAHGQLCGLFAGPVLFATIAQLRQETPQHLSLKRYEELARLVDPNATTAEDLAEWFSALAHQAAFDASSIAQLDGGALDALIDAVTVASSTKGNPVALDVDTLHTIVDTVAAR